jgi:fibrillarin-like pre-rRNA processing protein
MRSRTRYVSLARSPRLWRRAADDPPSYWTLALGDPPSMSGERTVEGPSGTLRRWDPNRSKLGAAVAKGWTDPLPRPGERWLYLGGASGTTASYVADLVGPAGTVYVVEKSLRSFARLLATAERYPNVAPLLGDARQPAGYRAWVPPADGLYADVAQADQAAIVLENARQLLRSDGSLLLALKTSSMGRGVAPRAHLDQALDALEGPFSIEGSIALDPFHRKHYLIGARATDRLVGPAKERSPAGRPTRPRPRGPRRP